MLTSKDNFNKWKGKKYTLLQEACKTDFLCFDVFFQEGPFAIVVLGKSFRVIRVNGRFDYIFGLTGKALIGRDIFEFLDSEDASILRNIFENRDSFRKPLLINLRFQQMGKAKLSIETFVILFVTLTSSVKSISFPSLYDLKVISLVKISKRVRSE